MSIRVKNDEQYIKTLLGINKELGDFAKEMKKQRDELLAALKKLSGMKLNMIADGIVDKAIASVKEETK